MRVVIQRVRQASVTIDHALHASIDQGLLILLGIEENDTFDDADWLTQKIASLRIFSDDKGKMNRDVLQSNGQILVVSQFTLHAATKKGNRPSFIRAARPEQAIPLYDYFVKQMTALLQKPVLTGKFGADMQVALVNDGPVTIWIDSKNKE